MHVDHVPLHHGVGDAASGGAGILRVGVAEKARVGNVIFNDALVNIAKNYLHKGSKIYLEGSLQTRKFTDSQGIEKYSTEVVLQGFNSVLTMLDTRSSQQGQGQNNQQREYAGGNNHQGGGYQQNQQERQPANAAANADLDDEIPF